MSEHPFRQDCLDFDATEGAECSGPVRRRSPLGWSRIGYLRCDHHWAELLRRKDHG